jgi:hypothetical protein
MSMKNSSDTIGNRTRDLPVCSAVPQPTAPPAACRYELVYVTINKQQIIFQNYLGFQSRLRRASAEGGVITNVSAGNGLPSGCGLSKPAAWKLLFAKLVKNFPLFVKTSV